MPKSRDTLVAEAVQLATLPEVYHELERAIADPTASLEDMSAIIARDTAFSAQLLRIANSSFYGFPREIADVTLALTVIGTRQVRDLLLASVAIRSFNALPLDAIDMEGFWRHSIAVGCAARVIATLRREPNVEQFYLAGLLHGLGLMLFFMGAPHDMGRALAIRDEKSLLLPNAERQVFGYDHAELGGSFLEAWGLPEALVQAVTYQHRPSEAGSYALEASATHVANIVVVALQIGNSGERYVPALDGTAYDSLDISPNETAQLVAHAERQYHDAVRLFLQ